MPPSSATALSSLTDYNTNRKSAQDITTDAQAQYDIPGITGRLSTLRGLVGNLQSSVNAVDPSVTGRTSGSFVTEGQRQALVNKERTPILGQLGEQQNALGQEEQGYQTASTLASQLASSVLSQDQTKYQSLLDQYNAAVAQEQAAEQKRQYEVSLAEQKRQFDAQQAAARAASSGGGYDLGDIVDALGKQNQPAAATSSNISSVEQLAYNDVAGRKGQSLDSLRSDYAATKRSADNGNQKDKLKLLFYSQIFPQYFEGDQKRFGGVAVPAAVLANGSSLRY